jgi:hypothetical protein
MKGKSSAALSRLRNFCTCSTFIAFLISRISRKSCRWPQYLRISARPGSTIPLPARLVLGQHFGLQCLSVVLPGIYVRERLPVGITDDIAVVNEPAKDGERGKRRTLVYRDRSEWIAVKVPAIVSQEVFDKAQERLGLNRDRYRQPATHYLLHKLVECGECGWGYSSFRRYRKVVHPSGKVAVYHEAAYRCNRRAQEGMHDRTQIKGCRNSRVSADPISELHGSIVQPINPLPSEGGDILPPLN